MVANRVKHLTTGFVLFVTSAIMLIVAIFGVSRAWFSNKQEAKMSGNVATLGVEVKQGNGSPSDTFTFTSSDIVSFSDDLQKPNLQIKLKSTSSIPVYARVRISANWATLDNDYESVFDVLDFTLNSSWKSFNVNNTIDNTKSTSNQIISNGFFYYRSSGSVVAPLSASDTPIILIEEISLKEGKSMPANLVLNIFAEVEQANPAGLTAFGFTIS